MITLVETTSTKLKLAIENINNILCSSYNQQPISTPPSHGHTESDSWKFNHHIINNLEEVEALAQHV